MIKEKKRIEIDFSRKQGRVRPLGGLNTGPLFGTDLSLSLSGEYRELGVPAVRTDGVEPPHGGRFVDLHCLFPDPSLDERFDMSFCFGPTDAYLGAIHELGAEIVLRLGESYDPYEPKPYYRIPRDPLKWARVCERVIAHYNKGWACGYKWGIKRVELICGFDRSCSGIAREEYFEFYSTVAKYLKQCYPKLRIGGYSSGGFFSLNNFNSNDEQKGYVDILEEFLAYVKADGAPLDHFTWECAASEPEELSLHASYARNYLDQNGFKRTESIVSRLTHVYEKDDTPPAFRRDLPSRMAASYIIAQKSGVDMMFQPADPRDSDCVLYSIEDRTRVHRYGAFRAASFFGRIWSLGTVVDGTADFWRELYSLASFDGEDGAVLVVSRNYSGIIEIEPRGTEFASYSIEGCIGGGARGEGRSSRSERMPLSSGKVLFKAGRDEVYLVSFYH